MKTLRSIIDDDRKRRDDMTATTAYGRKQLLAKLVAETEALVYGEHGISTELDYTSLAEARRNLVDLHSGESPASRVAFDDYLERLKSLPKNAFTIELRDFFNLVKASGEDVTELLSTFISKETAEVGSGPSILPTGFYDEVPRGDYFLRSNDYTQLKLYFDGELTTHDLTPFQGELLETLRLDSDTLSSKYSSRWEYSKMLELKTQLRSKLRSDKVFSWSEMNEFTKWDESFSSKALTFDRYTLYGLEAPPLDEPASVEMRSAFLDELSKLEGGVDSLRGKVAVSASGELMLKSTLLGSTRLKNWVAHQIEGLKFMPIMIPVMSAIGTLAGEDTVNYINIGLGVLDLVMSGNPASVAMALWGAAMHEWGVQRQRKLDNEHPDKYRGRNLARLYVDGVWRPALVKDIIKSTSSLSRDQEVTFEYGDELMWVFDNEGNLTPTFTNREEKRYLVADFEVEDKFISSKDYVDKYDHLRGWYFLGEEEQKKTVDDTMEGEPFEVEAYDTSGFTAWQKNVEGWRKALDIIQKDKWKPIIDTAGGDIEFFTEHNSYRALRDYGFDNGYEVHTRLDSLGFPSARNVSGFWMNSKYYNEMYDVAQEYISRGKIKQFVWLDEETYKKNKMTEDELYTFYQSKPFMDSYENEFLLRNIWLESFRNLVRTQRLAAKTSDYDKKHEGERAFSETIGMTTYDVKDAYHDVVQTYYSPYYLDFEKDLKTAMSPEELSEQLHLIDTYTDRGAIAKAYLHQKAINRFWTNEIAKRGGIDELYKYTTEIKSDSYAPPAAMMGSYAVFGTGYADFEMSTPLPYLTNYTPDLIKPTYIYPWLNEGEGFLLSDLEYDTEERDWDAVAFEDTEELLGEAIHAHVDKDGAIEKLEIRGEMFHPDEITRILKKLKRGEAKTTVSEKGFYHVAKYMREEHGIEVTSPEDVPDYIARDESGKINLYGTQLEDDPYVRQATDKYGKIHTVWAPEIITSH